MTDDIPADRSRGPASIAVPAIAGTLVCSALYAIYTPGLLNADSIDMLCQAIHRQYTDIHSPLMSIVWGWLNQISFGSAAMLLLIQVAYVTATILLAFQIANRTRTRLLAFAVLIAWPPILDSLGMVTTDSMFLWTYVLGIAATAWVLRGSTISSVRVAFLIAAAILMVAVRKDAVAPLIPLFAAVAYRAIAGGGRTSRQPRAAWLVAAAIGLAGSVVTLGLVHAVYARAIVVAPTYPEEVMYEYDLAGMSVRSHTDLFPPDVVATGVTLPYLEGKYSPADPGEMFYGPGLDIADIPDPGHSAELRRWWLAAIEHHPAEYLAHRRDIDAYFLDIAVEPDPIYYFQGATDSRYATFCPPLGGLALGATLARGELAYYVIRPLLNTAVYRLWAYDLVILACLLYAAFRLREDGLQARRAYLIVTLGFAAYFDQGLFLLLTQAGNFRYVWPSVFTCVLIVLLTAFEVVDDRRRRAA